SAAEERLRSAGGSREEASHLGGVFSGGVTLLVGLEVGARSVVAPQVPEADGAAVERAVEIVRRGGRGVGPEQPVEVPEGVGVATHAGPELGAREELPGTEAPGEGPPIVEQVQRRLAIGELEHRLEARAQ